MLSCSLRRPSVLWLTRFYAHLICQWFFSDGRQSFLTGLWHFRSFPRFRPSFLWNCPSFRFFVLKWSFEFQFRWLSFWVVHRRGIQRQLNEALIWRLRVWDWIMREIRFVLSILFDFVSTCLFIFGLDNFDSFLKSFNCLFTLDFFFFFDLLGFFKLIIVFGFEIFVEVQSHLFLFDWGVFVSLGWSYEWFTLIDSLLKFCDFVQKFGGGLIIFGELFELNKKGVTILETLSAAVSRESLSYIWYFLSFFSEIGKIST